MPESGNGNREICKIKRRGSKTNSANSTVFVLYHWRLKYTSSGVRDILLNYGFKAECHASKFLFYIFKRVLQKTLNTWNKVSKNQSENGNDWPS